MERHKIILKPTAREHHKFDPKKHTTRLWDVIDINEDWLTGAPCESETAKASSRAVTEASGKIA